jgi:NAD(P)-dependent dehydrogenase (short-subunit alcohol dehydrogenase family)
MPDASSNPPTPDLAGRVVVVLGGTLGLGRQVARTLAAAGARLVVADWPADSGLETVDLIRAADGQAHFVQANLDSDTSLARLVEETEAVFGPPEAVIQEAPAVSGGPLLTLMASDWETVVSRSLRRAFLAAQAFMPGLLARGTGTLLGLVMPQVLPGLSAFVAAQHGLLAFNRSLAAEIGPGGVRVVSLGLAPDTPHVSAAHAAAYLLAQPAQADDEGLVQVDTVLARAGFNAGAPASPAHITDRAGHLAQAIVLNQQLATMLLDTDVEFDRLPVAVRPMARGVFLSKVGHRSQDVLRAVNKLGDQLLRMQGSHSGTDTEFQVDFPLIADLFERLGAYYRSVADETTRLTPDPVLAGQLRHQMAEREALIQNLLASLTAVHA